MIVADLAHKYPTRMMNGNHLALEEAKLAPSQEYGVNLPGWGFLRFTRGEGYFLRGSQIQPLRESDVVVVGIGQEGSIRSSQISDLFFQYFVLRPELLLGLLSVSERHAWEAAARQPKNFFRYFPSTSPLAQQFCALCQQARAGNGLMVRSQMLHLASTVLHSEVPTPAPTSGNNGAAGATPRERFERLMRQISDSELQHYSLSDLAKLCGCSPRHFSRLFRERFGSSLLPKKIEVRLQKAQQLLRDTDSKIIDVAMECGYQHLGLFNSVFKKNFRMTPSQWRKRQRRK